jgi:hypothetical protein
LSCEEQLGPSTYIVREALLLEDLCGVFRVDVVEETGDVEKKEGPHVAGLSGGLDLMNEGGNGINGVVFWLRAKL